MSTADVLDKHPDYHCCEVAFAQYGGRAEFEGLIRTVRCYEDNTEMRRLLNGPGAGSVLVVDAGGLIRCALFGGVGGANAVRNGWAGVVIYGALRDVAELRELPLGVKALAATPRRPRGVGAHQVDVPVTFGGTTFTPGAMLWSDGDGIVVSPRAE